MTVAVMQPYFFPYLGYFQLVKAVEKFVFFDDVNFIMKGWINRNRVLGNNGAQQFSVPLAKASQNRKINEIQLVDFSFWRSKFLKTIEDTYKKAPYFNDIFPWLYNILVNREFTTINDLASSSIRETAHLLKIDTSFTSSGNLNYARDERGGEKKILSICSVLEASDYINPKNGETLYNKENFTSQNITIKFLSMDVVEYKQFDNTFMPGLSILDVLMFNDCGQIQKLLNKYSLS